MTFCSPSPKELGRKSIYLKTFQIYQHSMINKFSAQTVGTVFIIRDWVNRAPTRSANSRTCRPISQKEAAPTRPGSASLSLFSQSLYRYGTVASLFLCPVQGRIRKMEQLAGGRRMERMLRDACRDRHLPIHRHNAACN